MLPRCSGDGLWIVCYRIESTSVRHRFTGVQPRGERNHNDKQIIQPTSEIWNLQKFRALETHQSTANQIARQGDKHSTGHLFQPNQWNLLRQISQISLEEIP